MLRLLNLWSTKTPVGKAQDEVKVSGSFSSPHSESLTSFRGSYHWCTLRRYVELFQKNDARETNDEF